MDGNGMRVLVTGADGLLGSNLVRILLERNYQVRTFLLTGTRAVTLEGLPVEKIYGNLLDADSVQEAIQGMDYVIHVAANTNVWPVRSELTRRVNIEGTRHVIAACQTAGIKRLVHISSAASFGFGTKEHPGDETTSFNQDKYGLDYIDSKYEAQKMVLQAVAAGDLEAVIINPTFMFGPYDSKPSSGKMILSIYEGKVPGYSPGGKSIVDVRDVATAAANAMYMGRVGECYIAGNENLSYQEIFTRIASVLGVKPPRVPMPRPVVKSYGWISTFGGRLFGITPGINHAMAAISCDGHYFSSAKAVRELKMPQSCIDTAIADSFDWLLANGYVKQGRKAKQRV